MNLVSHSHTKREDITERKHVMKYTATHFPNKIGFLGKTSLTINFQMESGVGGGVGGTWAHFHPMFQDLCSTGKNESARYEKEIIFVK